MGTPLGTNSHVKLDVHQIANPLNLLDTGFFKENECERGGIEKRHPRVFAFPGFAWRRNMPLEGRNVLCYHLCQGLFVRETC
jgi:hypothetical protein